MSIWNKVLIGLIGIAALAFFGLATATLRISQYWGESAQAHIRKIEQLKQSNVKLITGEGEGPAAKPGIRQLRSELNELLVERSRAWFKCDPTVKLDAKAATATVTLVIEQPDPHGMAKDTVVYAFEEADAQKQGRYMGQFKVDSAADKKVELVPSWRLSPRELERLGSSKGLWTVYETMPHDNHQVFAAVSDEDKKAMLPASVLPQYTKDGKPSTKDDPAENVADGKYVRPLRDYQVLLGSLRLHRTLVNDRIDADNVDLKLVTHALEQGRQQEEATKTQLATTKDDAEKQGAERDAVGGYRKLLEQTLETTTAEIAKLIETNRAKAGRIAKLQTEATRLIDARSRSMAQSRTGS